jgi:hypothetical protein
VPKELDKLGVIKKMITQYLTRVEMQKDLPKLLKQAEIQGKVKVYIEDTDSIYVVLSEPKYNTMAKELSRLAEEYI